MMLTAQCLPLGAGAWGGRACMEYYAGYSWTRPDVVDEYSHGTVATPRWAKRVKSGLMLDNGAFPAWRDGVELTLCDQMAAMVPFLSRSTWVIAPDKVGAGAESWARTLHALNAWPQHAPRLLLPAQEGCDLSELIMHARRAGGIFVGGRTYEWKIQVTKMVRALGFMGRIHVGRISRPQHLCALSALATAIDNTSWVRAQHYNRRLPIGALLREFMKPCKQ